MGAPDYGAKVTGRIILIASSQNTLGPPSNSGLFNPLNTSMFLNHPDWSSLLVRPEQVLL